MDQIVQDKAPLVGSRHDDAAAARAVDALVENAVARRFDDLDAATVGAAKERIIDVIGSAIGGVNAGGNAALLETYRSWGGEPAASICASNVRLPAAHAAMVNAIMARSYDFEVMHTLVGDRMVPSHHAATTVPAALALCQALRLGGQEMIAAVVIADDIAARLIAASGIDFGEGWDGTGSFTALASAVLAGRLYGLSPDEMRSAMGIAVNQIAGSVATVWDGTTDFKLVQGAAGRIGIFSAELARGGWIGMDDPLLGHYGFYDQYTAGCTDPAILTADLGKTFYAEAYFKPYPACAATQLSLECALGLHERGEVSPDQIDRIEVRMAAAPLRNFCNKPYRPRRFAHCDAIFSYPFQVANALLNGRTRQEHYDEARLRAPALQALADKVELEALPAGGEGVEIDIRTTDGRTVAATQKRLSRDPRIQRASHDEIVAKFRQQAAFSGALPRTTTEALLARLERLEHEPNVNGLAALFGGEQYTPTS